MIRVKERTVLCVLDFHEENTAMEYAFIRDVLIDQWTARRKSTTLFEFDVEYLGVEGLDNVIKAIEIYLEKSRDSVVLYYFLPTGINGAYKYYQTTIGKTYGDPDTNPLGL